MDCCGCISEFTDMHWCPVAASPHRAVCRDFGLDFLSAERNAPWCSVAHWTWHNLYSSSDFELLRKFLPSWRNYGPHNVPTRNPHFRGLGSNTAMANVVNDNSQQGLATTEWWMMSDLAPAQSQQCQLHQEPLEPLETEVMTEVWWNGWPDEWVQERSQSFKPGNLVAIVELHCPFLNGRLFLATTRQSANHSRSLEPEWYQ